MEENKCNVIPSLLDLCSKHSWIKKSIYKGFYQQFIIIVFFAIFIDAFVISSADALSIYWGIRRHNTRYKLWQLNIIYYKVIRSLLGICGANV